MAAKFSMVNTSGLFDQGAHLEASDRMQGAMEELKIKNERAEAAKQQQRAEQEKQEKLLVQRALRSQEAAIAAARQKDATYVRAKRDDADIQQQSGDDDDSDDDDALLDELEHDPELERLRAARMQQLKQAFEEKQELLAKGHGEYREIDQDAFLREVTGSPRVAVHFYHSDFERCKIMDMHLRRLAKTHIECKFLKLNAEKAPFFVEKLAIRVLPTVVCFRDGIAFPVRVIGFDGLTRDDAAEERAAFGTRGHLTSSDTFPTIALARKLVQIGAIDEHDADEDDDDEDNA